MTPDELAVQLHSPDGPTRLRAAMAAGSTPDPAIVEVLVERCGVDPDFFVRDMLTWALTRLPADLTVPRLTEELSSPFPQARSQALHTLSKIRDARARPFITAALLHDEEDEVARAAWRAAVVLVVAGGGARAGGRPRDRARPPEPRVLAQPHPGARRPRRGLPRAARARGVLRARSRCGCTPRRRC